MMAPPLAVARGALPAVVRRPPPPRSRRRGFVLPRYSGAGLAAVLFGMVATVGILQGGHWPTIRQAAAEFPNALGRMSGFGLQRITISGQIELNEREIVAAAGVDSRQSLIFLDVAQIREKILGLPLVESASVRKLYPNDLLIDITEREAYAVWQRDGELRVIASDGTPTEKMRDPRFVELPLVVGEGANKRAKDYVALLDAAPELRSRIRAGSLIGERRWNLTLTNGVLVRLPEVDPAEAMKRLAKAQREQRLLERDVLAIDMREPDRITVRLSAEPAENRLDAARKKMGKWMGNDA